MPHPSSSVTREWWALCRRILANPVVEKDTYCRALKDGKPHGEGERNAAGDPEGAGVMVQLFCWQGGSLAPGQVQPGDWEPFDNFDEDDLCVSHPAAPPRVEHARTHANTRTDAHTTHPPTTKMRTRWWQVAQAPHGPGRVRPLRPSPGARCRPRPRFTRVCRRQSFVGMARRRARGPAGVEGGGGTHLTGPPSQLL